MEEVRRVTKYTRKNAPYGKGDSRRPGDDEAYRRNWERIFGNNQQDNNQQERRQESDS